MDTLLSLKVFREVVQQGSFTKAADKLGISTAMTSKHVNHLENSIQAKLLHRNSRHLHLTEAGEEYYRQCSYALDTLATAAERAASGKDTPQGLLKITMPAWFANPLFAKWIVEYQALYPEVSVDLILDNRKVDLIAEGFDLALRVTNDPHPSLIVKPLAHIEFYLVAAPSYLRRFGVITTLEDAQKHQAILQSYVDMTNLIFEDAQGQSQHLHLSARIRADNTLMVHQLLLSGGGIGLLPSWVVDNDLALGKLVRLLPQYRMLSATLYATYADRAFLTAKVRSFIDFLAQKLQISK